MAIKPMSCPGHIEVFKSRPRSYRELPLKLFEFGHVHRKEASGALSGWLRLRGFVQDDSHVFASLEQLPALIDQFVELVEQAYPKFGFEEWSWKISLRPEQRAGSEEGWDQAERALREACQARGLLVEEKPGEGAFYGPKLEAVLKDRLGRSWQCGVVQVDFVLPDRFELEYQDAKGQWVRPVMLHHAVLGSLERWLAIVMEHHGGLPDALHPQPVAVLPVSDRHSEKAKEWAKAIEQSIQRPVVILDKGPLKGRLKEADGLMIPWRWVVGDQEQDIKGIGSVRRGHESVQSMSLEEWVDLVAKEGLV